MSYTPIAIPTAFERHVINRFTFGYTPTVRYEMQKAGGALRWFDSQLDHHKIHDPKGDKLKPLFPLMSMTPTQIFDSSKTRPINPGTNHQDSAYNTCMRIVSKRQVFEVMHDFWRNLFYVSGSAPGAFLPQYDERMRKVALTKFENVLKTAETSGAMRGMLSSLNGVNENHPRELLELHTVGVGKYTESDVKNLLKLTSGWAYHLNTDEPVFNDLYTVIGRVKILGFDRTYTKPGSQPKALDDFLSYVARHPDTKYNVCRRLAQRFVDDTPPYSLVKTLVATWTKTDGDIKAILKTLVRSSEFAASVNKPVVRLPHYDLTGVERHMIKSFDDASIMENLAYWNIWTLGNMAYGPYLWEMPNGLSERSADWATPSIMIASSKMHWNVFSEECRGHSNQPGATFRQLGDFWPRSNESVTVRELIDHQCRRVWGRPSVESFVKTTAKLIGLEPDSTVSKSTFDKQKFAWLMTSVFDAPEWMGR